MFGSKLTRVSYLFIALAVSNAIAVAQPIQAAGVATAREPYASVPMSAKDRDEVLQAVIREMNTRYVFPEVAKQVEATLAARKRANEYAGVTDPIAYAAKLTDHIYAIARDKHIRVTFSPDAIPERMSPQEPTPDELAKARLDAAKLNFGVEKVERLPLNVGYVELRKFEMVGWSGDTIAAAMNLLAHSDALIVDLRRNIGGDPATVALMTSYLLDERTHLSSFFDRGANALTQSWSLDWVPGKRFGGSKPVYVLTSNRTGSGAEEFAYNLKSLKRAKLVGEITAGAANPGRFSKLTKHFAMFVPDGRVINPITNTNWEGVGVSPDTGVPSDDALRVAQTLAIKELLVTNRDPRFARAATDRLALLEAGRS